MVILSQPKHFSLKLVIFLTVLAFLLPFLFYLYQIDLPPLPLWDETIHLPPIRAFLLKDGPPYPYGNNPPLGREIIGLSISIFGDKPFAHRLPSALCGAGLSALLFFGTTFLTKRISAGLLAAGFWMSSTLAFVHARVGTLDMMLALFFVGSLIAFLVVLNFEKITYKKLFLYLACLLASLASATKVLGLILFPLFLLGLGFIRKKWPLKESLVTFLVGSFLSLLLVFTLSYMIWGYAPTEILGQLQLIYQKQSTLHPDYKALSPWYHWFLFRGDHWYGTNPFKSQWAVLSINNPIIWVFGSLGVVVLMVRGLQKRVPRLGMLFLCIIMQILFWTIFKRQTILYYALPMVPLFCMAIPWSLSELTTSKKSLRGPYFAISCSILLGANLFFWHYFPQLRIRPFF